MVKRCLTWVFVAAAIWTAGGLAACKHTAHGVGEDTQKVGEKIQDKTD